MPRRQDRRFADGLASVDTLAQISEQVFVNIKIKAKLKFAGEKDTSFSPANFFASTNAARRDSLGCVRGIAALRVALA